MPEQKTLPTWITNLNAAITPGERRDDVLLDGHPWIYWGFDASLSHHEQDPITGETTRLLSITERQAGRYDWESARIMAAGEWYVRARGCADSPQAAAESAFAFDHAVLIAGGHEWLAGSFYGLATWETRIDDEIIRVTQNHSGTWSWSRAIDLRRFHALGIYLFDERLTGECATAEDAMAAALEAPTLMRAACRAYLADTQSRPADPAATKLPEAA